MICWEDQLFCSLSESYSIIFLGLTTNLFTVFRFLAHTYSIQHCKCVSVFMSPAEERYWVPNHNVLNCFFYARNSILTTELWSLMSILILGSIINSQSTVYHGLQTWLLRTTTQSHYRFSQLHLITVNKHRESITQLQDLRTLCTLTHCKVLLILSLWLLILLLVPSIWPCLWK